MRVEPDFPAGDGAQAFRPEGRVLMLDLEGHDLADERETARLVTRIYRYAREGRAIAVPQTAPSLAALCEKTGLSVISPAAGRVPADSAFDVAFGVDADALGDGEQAAHEDGSGRRLRVAVAGLGLVGGGAALRLLADHAAYDFCAALVREPFKDRSGLVVEQVTNDISAFLAAKPDVVIDALPDGAAGRRLIESALDRGVSVVSANKQALAGALADLAALAEENDARLCYAASVGGGAPFVETTKRARREGEIAGLEATLNGTVNYILTALASGERFDAAVKAAQQAGFAEPDPSADLSGADAKAKLAILSFTAFGEEIDLGAIDIEPLTAAKAATIANAGGVWRQISRLERTNAGELRASVRFERRDDDALFSGARFEANALRIRLSGDGLVECRGKGAGRAPTVESIFGDLEEIRRAAAFRPKRAGTLAQAGATA